MKNRKAVYLLLLCGWLFSFAIHAQDYERKWAIKYTGGVLAKPVLTSNPQSISIGNGGEGVFVGGEYYLPRLWGLQAGYFRTEVDYGEFSRTMEGLQLGAKKYFIHPDFIFQPYVSGNVQINWGRHTEYAHYIYDAMDRQQSTRNPRLSFVPGVGFDFYLFSSVAFVMEYNFSMGINSKTDIMVKPTHSPHYTLKDKGLHHYLGLGVKITFPFEFSAEDGMNLFNILMSAIIDDWYY